MSCDNIPTTVEIEQAKKDITDFNTFMTSTSDTFVDSKSVSRLTLQGAINKFSFGTTDFTFTEGGTLSNRKLLVSNDPIDGFLYRYVGTGSFPITVTAGTDPTTGTDWEAFTATSAEFVGNANGGSVQDFIDDNPNVTLSPSDTIFGETKRNKNAVGCMVFVFDDGRRTTFENGLSLFNAQGEVANAALIGSRLLDRHPYDASNASLADWLLCQSAGWGITCHGYALTSVYDSAFKQLQGDEELNRQHELLNSLGFKVNLFTAPSSVLDAKFLTTVKSRFGAAFIGVNTADPTVTDTNGDDPYSIKRVSLESNLTTESLFNTFADYCKNNNTLGVVYAHEIDGTFGTVPLTSSRLNAAIDYCQSIGLDIVTVDEAVQRFCTNTFREEYIGGKNTDLSNLLQVRGNRLVNSEFAGGYSNWVFGAGTVGATASVESNTAGGKFKFTIPVGAGLGTTQIRQDVACIKRSSPTQLFAHCNVWCSNGALENQTVFLDVSYLIGGSVVTYGTKTVNQTITTVPTRIDISDIIPANTSIESVRLVIRISNPQVSTVETEISVSEIYLGYADEPWNSASNTTNVRVGRSAIQTAVPQAGSIILFNTITKDTLGEYDSVTGKYTCKVAGVKNISAAAMISDLGFGFTGTEIRLELRLNDASILKNRTSVWDGNRYRRMVQISASMYLNVGDTIAIRLSHDIGTDQTIAAGADSTWMCIA